jgi:acetoin utilization deacetylase AcuC-like enzyme
MIVFHHPEQDRHDPAEPHRFEGKLLPPAETASRARRILAGLRSAGLDDVRAPGPIDEASLEAVHTTGYLRFLRTAHDRWRQVTGGSVDGEAVPYVRPRRGDPDHVPSSVLAELGWHSFDVDPILAGTWEAARASAASALAAARIVSAGERVAYALCRPPGHHATADQFGGYCYLNNVAIAAAWCAADGHRVAVLDLDAHHGNGTQSIFWTRGDVFTVSIHGDPDRHYPFFTGAREETGAAGGEGANLNVPLPSGADRRHYEPALNEAVRSIYARGADLLIVALGVDTDTVDGVLSLRGSDYSRIGERLAGARLPTVFVQEGGYGAGTLERNVPAVLLGFLDTA